MENCQNILSRAKEYPYSKEQCSFIYYNGKAIHINMKEWNNVQNLLDNIISVICDEDARNYLKKTEYHSVLAVGSNSSVEVLNRKYASFKEPVIIPVIQGVLNDFDVVYTSNIISYGSCPATLQYSSGSYVELYITYLTDNQLKYMMETERGYTYCQLSGIKLNVGVSLEEWRIGKKAIEIIDNVFHFFYTPLCIPYKNKNTCIALKEIKTYNRMFPELSQSEILNEIMHIENLNGDENELDKWILSNINNFERLGNINKKLEKYIKTFEYENNIIIKLL